jgi:hypothetical protein
MLERYYSPTPHGASWIITKEEWNTSIIKRSYENEVNYLIQLVEKRTFMVR